PVAAIEGTGSSEGSVTGFGSVFVNGVEYSTDRADIVIDGMSASESVLQVGMVVNVAGDIAADGKQGSAQRVEFDRPLFGPIDAIDRAARVVTMLGQSVRLDDATLFGDGVEDSLQEGQLCLVSGYPAANGELLASLLRCGDDYVAGQTVVEVEGLVSNLDSGAGRFRLGEFEVNIGTAVLDVSRGALANGALVEIIGRQPQRNGSLNAERIRVKTVTLQPGQAVLLEGVISRFAGLNDFELGRQRIDAAAAQRDDAHTLAPARDVRMRLQGVVRADDVITAARYALQPATDILLTGRVDGVDSARERLALFGADHQAVVVTQYEDTRVNGSRRFRLQDLQAGDYVQLRGFRDAQDRTVVTRIERRTEEEPTSGTVVARFRVGVGTVDPLLAKVRGPLDRHDLSQNTLVIAGVTVQTDAARTEFFGRDGASVTAIQFYNGLRPGDRLEAEGNEASDVLEATRVRYAR
ncbi:MAG: DUF5666 domain-containing protein, partial [Nevskiales bacterium]